MNGKLKVEVPVITYSQAEERANTISHLAGFVAALVAIIIFSFQAWSQLTLTGNVGIWIYGITLLCALGSSSIYHGTSNRRLKLLYKKLDHMCIYLLISGSYSVLIFNRLMNWEGYVFLGLLWGMSVIGIWFKARYVHRFKVLSTLMYIIMGYIFFINPNAFYEVLKPETIKTLAICGGVYTVGAGFYLWKSKSWTHFIWHILVLVGVSLHFYAVYTELLG